MRIPTRAIAARLIMSIGCLGLDLLSIIGFTT